MDILPFLMTAEGRLKVMQSSHKPIRSRIEYLYRRYDFSKLTGREGDPEFEASDEFVQTLLLVLGLTTPEERTGPIHTVTAALLDELRTTLRQAAVSAQYMARARYDQLPEAEKALYSPTDDVIGQVLH